MSNERQTPIPSSQEPASERLFPKKTPDQSPVDGWASYSQVAKLEDRVERLEQLAAALLQDRDRPPTS